MRVLPRNICFTLNLPAGLQACHAAFWSPPNLPHSVSPDLHEFKLLYLLHGHGALVGPDGGMTELKPGSLLLRPPRIPHSIVRRAGSPWLEFALTLPEEVHGHFVGLGILPQAFWSGWTAVLDPLVGRFEEVLNEAQAMERSAQAGFLLRLQQLIIDLVGRERAPSVPSSYREARRILGEELERPLDMPGVAKRVGLGYHTFRKGFVQHFGISPKEYRICRVVERAQDLLADPDRNLWCVAQALGYPDAASFSKQFKRVTGVPPSQFRKG
ncbi:MAG: helix-turn-helix domain-containing protein [Planctomycetota bacterium]|jgi:AraC-like DNA-binding protein